MNPSSKYRSNRLQLVAITRSVVIAAFLGAVGLSWVFLKNQLNSSGSQRKVLEQTLHELIVQNNVLETRIGTLTCRTALQRRVDEGFIKLVPISAQAVVHVRPPEFSRRQTADRDSESQFQTVSREGFVRP